MKRFVPRRWSLAAPRMTVRTHVPLGWRVAAAVVVVGASIAAGFLLSRSGVARAVVGSADPALDRASAEVRALRAERDRLAAAGPRPTDAGRAIEGATIRELGAEVARLEADNARLKEDVAFFEAATADRPAAGAVDATSGIAIRRFQVTRDSGSGTARYRLLLTQDSRATRDFVGSLELAVTLDDGGPVSIVLPRDASRLAAASAAPLADRTSPFDVAFRSYKRLDGTFALPPGATLKAVQARILERGVVRVQQTYTLH